MIICSFLYKIIRSQHYRFFFYFEKAKNKLKYYGKNEKIVNIFVFNNSCLCICVFPQMPNPLLFI